MLTTKRTITDDDRQGGYTTTVNRPMPVFNFDNRAPRPDVSAGYSDYEMDRLDSMRMRSAPAEPDTYERQSRYRPSAQRRVYSEEDLMPSIQTMQAVRTGKAKRSVAKRIEKEAAQGRPAAERKGLSQNAKLLIAVYAIIVFIALVLIIASGIAVNAQADKAAKLEAEKAQLQTEVTAQEQAVMYFTPNLTAEGYEEIADGEVTAFALKTLGETTEYETRTNWFDRICDFFSRWGGK